MSVTFRAPFGYLPFLIIRQSKPLFSVPFHKTRVSHVTFSFRPPLPLSRLPSHVISGIRKRMTPPDRCPQGVTNNQKQTLIQGSILFHNCMKLFHMEKRTINRAFPASRQYRAPKQQSELQIQSITVIFIVVPLIVVLSIPNLFQLVAAPYQPVFRFPDCATK